jgi:hypothetical protein
MSALGSPWVHGRAVLNSDKVDGSKVDGSKVDGALCRAGVHVPRPAQRHLVLRIAPSHQKVSLPVASIRPRGGPINALRT